MIIQKTYLSKHQSNRHSKNIHVNWFLRSKHKPLIIGTQTLLDQPLERRTRRSRLNVMVPRFHVNGFEMNEKTGGGGGGKGLFRLLNVAIFKFRFHIIIKLHLLQTFRNDKILNNNKNNTNSCFKNPLKSSIVHENMS